MQPITCATPATNARPSLQLTANAPLPRAFAEGVEFRDSPATKTVGRFGACPAPEPAKCPTFNTVIFGAGVAPMRVKQICRSSDGKLSGTCGEDIDAPRSTCHIFAPRFLPSFRAESTDNALQTLSEFLAGSYSPKVRIRRQSGEIGHGLPRRVWLMLNNFSSKILYCGSSKCVCEITLTSGFRLLYVFSVAQYGHEQLATLTAHCRPFVTVIGHSIRANLVFAVAALVSILRRPWRLLLRTSDTIVPLVSGSRYPWLVLRKIQNQSLSTPFRQDLFDLNIIAERQR
jgi:hypothetical protein